MKIVLVEGSPGAGTGAEVELRAAGHTVVGCDAVDPSAPCRGLEVVSTCPLDDGDVDVAVVSRSGSAAAPSERGALCAARRRVPVVVAGNPRHAVSFGPGTHLAGDDLVGACERAARSGAAHSSAVRRQLLISGVVQPDEVDGPVPRFGFEVDRSPGRLRLVVRTREGEPHAAAVTKSAVEALRAFDPHTPLIDVVQRTF